ncbi:hypothetical protein D3C81_1821610 [compost metagenome]
MPPNAFSIMILSRFTEVAEVFVSAIRPFAICSGGFRENSRIEFTGPSELTERSGNSRKRSDPYP